jgi:hypothetical protein
MSQNKTISYNSHVLYLYLYNQMPYKFMERLFDGV